MRPLIGEPGELRVRCGQGEQPDVQFFISVDDKATGQMRPVALIRMQHASGDIPVSRAPEA